MTNFQSKQRSIDRTTLEFRILQLLQRFQIRRDPESNDVIYVNTHIRFDIKFISEQLSGADPANVLSALSVLQNHKEDNAPYPLVFRHGVNWIVSQQGVQFFCEAVRNIWHNTTQSVAAHRSEALMGAKEELGRWVPTDMTNAALTSPNPPSSQDADGAMIDTVERVSRIRQAAAHLRTTPQEAETAIANGTARKCKKCGRLLWIDAFRKREGNLRRTMCRKCEKTVCETK